MASDSEEQNPQQTRGRNGVGSRRKKQRISQEEAPKQKRAGGTRPTKQKISEGEVPERKGRKRGRPPSSELSKQKRKEKHKEVCRKYRNDRKAELQRLLNIEKMLLAKFGTSNPDVLKAELQRLLNIEKMLLAIFGTSNPEILKEILLKKFGVTEEDLEAIRKEALWEELGKVWQTSEDEIPAQKKILQDKAEEDLWDGCGPWCYGQSPALVGKEVAMKEPINQDAAEFSRFHQTEIKQETMDDKFGVTEAGLEDKEKRAFNAKEKVAKFLLEDERIEELLDVGNEKLAETMEGLEALIGSQSPTPGGKEAAMNEPNNQDAFLLHDGSNWFNIDQLEALIGSQPPTPGGKKAAMNEPNNQDAFLLQDGSLGFNIAQFTASLLGQSPLAGGEEPAINELINQDNVPSNVGFISWLNDNQYEISGQKMSWASWQYGVKDNLYESGTLSNAQSPTEVCEDAAMDGPINPDEFLPVDYGLISSHSGKVQFQTLQSKPVLTDRVNEQNLIASTGAAKAWDKVGTSELYKGTADGKDNGIGIMSMDQECTSKTSAAAVMDWGSKGTKPCVLWKGSGSRSAGSVVPTGKIGHQKEGKKVTTGVHFR